LAPQPRVNLTRFHGVFAPHHRLRARIAPGRGDRDLDADANQYLSGNVIAVSRDFEHTFARQPSNDESYQLFRELATAIERDLKAQFLFQ
jgi:hypothetical protein